MSCAATENENVSRPKSNLISISDPKPKKAHPISQLSSNNGSNKSSNIKINKLFTSVTLGSIGCSGISWPVSAPAVTQSAAEWDSKKQKTKKKKNKKKQRKIGSNGCCTPPGIGFAHDVVPIVRVDAQPRRRNHRERSCAASRRNVDTEHVSALTSPIVTPDTSHAVSDARQIRRFMPTSYPLLPEIMISQRNLLLEESLNTNDQFGEWRLNVDTMSYEELLDLGDKIGYVSTGLQEDEIMRGLEKTRYSNSKSLPSSLVFRDRDWKCSICQGGCKEDGDVGRLVCGHYHHMNCIKQWLLRKNVCPVCKTEPVIHKQDRDI